MAQLLHHLIQFLSILHLSLSSFHPSFQSFLIDYYGEDISSRLSRKDLGNRGSFGGTNNELGSRASEQAVVIVHGVTNSAGSFNKIRVYLESHGHQKGSVYGTTYGDAGKTNALMVTLNCDYVKQIRLLIQSVAAFTKRKIDVLAFSLGGPIARKAIMGGTCIDTYENIGMSLSPLIDTFVSVAGANQGSALCFLPFPGICNINNGLHCNSAFIRDINSKSRYEGDYIFSIYSQQDDKVGYRNSCGGISSRIYGQNTEFIRGGNHDHLMFSTVSLQKNLITRHSA